MIFQFLGTAAYEWIPAMYCECDNCKKARANGGKDIRTRSQAIINNELLIDFSTDTYMNALKNGIDMAGIEHCLITHSHPDHFYVENILARRPGYGHLKNRRSLHIYGSKLVVEEINRQLKGFDVVKDDIAQLHEVNVFEPFRIMDYEVTPLPALHDPKSGPVIYMVRQGGKCLLYAHDTGLIDDDTLKYLKKQCIHFDFVTLDCTGVMTDIRYGAHMNVERDIKARDSLKEIGVIDERTRVFLNHFSHNGKNVIYSELCPIVNPLGFEVSYDGLKIEL